MARPAAIAWTPELLRAIAKTIAEDPTRSNAELATILSSRTGEDITKDAVQKAKRRNGLTEVQEEMEANGAAALADAIDRATSAQVRGYKVRGVSITEQEHDDTGTSRRISVNYAAPRIDVVPAQVREPNYMKQLPGAPVDKTERLVAVMGDTQFPFEDPTSWALTLGWLRDVRPGEIVLTGDVIDGWAVSRFEKDPREGMSLQAEMQYAHNRLAEMRDAVGPDATITYIQGNHDIRAERYIQNQAPQLIGIKDPATGDDLLSFTRLLGLDHLGIDLVEKPEGALGDGHMNGVYRITPDLVATHGFYSRGGRTGGGGVSIMPLVDSWDCSVIGGHDHKQGIGIVTKGGVAGSPMRRLRAISTGMLCRRDLGYQPVGTSNWQPGFVAVSVATDGTWVPELIEIVDGKIVWRGSRWGSK